MNRKELFIIVTVAVIVSFVTTLFIAERYDASPVSIAQTTQKITEQIPAKVPESMANIQQQVITIANKSMKSVAAIKVMKNVQPRYRGRRRNSPFGNDPFEEFFKEFFGDRFKRSPRYNPKREAIGTGFVIDEKEGLIVSNNHVVGNADQIEVTINGKRFKAELVGTDKDTDIGLIKLKKFSKGDIEQLDFADSEKIQPGQFSIAVGNPFGLSQTVTFGIISAKGRSGVNITEYEDFIQTDAAINPGNSGGPLLNIKGKVLGMNTAIFSKSGGYMGIGFAVPANMIKAVIAQLKDGKEVKRAQMGIIIQDLTDELKKHLNIDSKTNGILVASVAKGSPAQKAGIKSGDVIVEFNGKPVKTTAQLRNRVAFSATDKKVPVKLLREGKEMIMLIKLTSTESEFAYGDGDTFKHKELGFVVEQKDGRIEIIDVDQGSVAAMAGLRPGDIIHKLNKRQIKNIKTFKKIVTKSDSILFLIEREGRKFYVVLNK